MFGFFILQSLVFAVIVEPSYIETRSDGYETRTGGVVPDGNRHIAAVTYYAEQPLSAGPFIHDMSANELWLGDLERFPSYLYYYLLSFPMRVAIGLGLSDAMMVLMIRLIGTVVGVIGLWVVYKIARELRTSQQIAHLSVLATALTGVYAWLAPAENYDMLALLLWLGFVLMSLRLFTRQHAKYLVPMAILFSLGSITKYTYIPFMTIAGGAALALYIYGLRNTGGLRGGFEQLKLWITSQKWWKTTLVSLLLVVSAGLFTERIIGNLLVYQSFSPSCAVVHSKENCGNFAIYDRNVTRKAAYEAEIARGETERVIYNPLTYTPFWIDRYYASIFGYVGHIWIYNFWPGMYIGAIAASLLVALLLVVAKLRRIRLLQSTGERWLAGVIAMLVIAQYTINARTFVNYGGELYAYAHQGRYLLSAICIGYILLLLVITRSLRALAPSRHYSWLLPLSVLVLVAAAVTNMALVTFFVHATGSDWYSTFAENLL